MTNETTPPADDPVASEPNAPGAEGIADPSTPTDLDAVREVVLRAHPDVVPELVAGTTVAELLASVGPAEEAYRRVAGRIGQVPTASVPAGGERPMPVDPDRLPASEKIRRALARGER